MTPPMRLERRNKRLDELFRLLDGTSSADECFAILQTAWNEGAGREQARVVRMVQALGKKKDSTDLAQPAWTDGYCQACDDLLQALRKGRTR